MLSWLRWAGFTIGGGTPISKKQHRSTCGFVAAWVWAMVQAAVDGGAPLAFSSIDTPSAYGRNVWKSGYKDVLTHLTEDAGRSIATHDVQSLCRAWGSGARRAVIGSSDECMASFVKDMYSLAWGYGLLGDQNDLDMEGERVSSRFRQRQATDGFRQLISNTTDSSLKGFHWFNIAYCCPPPLLGGAPDTELAEAEMALAEDSDGGDYEYAPCDNDYIADLYDQRSSSRGAPVSAAQLRLFDLEASCGGVGQDESDSSEGMAEGEG